MHRDTHTRAHTLTDRHVPMHEVHTALSVERKIWDRVYSRREKRLSARKERNVEKSENEKKKKGRAEQTKKKPEQNY